MSKAISCKNGTACTFQKEGKCKFTHPSAKSQPKVAKPNGVGKVKKMNFANLIVSKEFKALAANRAKRKELFAKYKMDMSSYFDVKDSKDVKISSNSLFDRELNVLDEEFALMRGMMRANFGNQLIKIKLWSLDNWAIAGNNITGVIAVDPSPITEFTTLAALFDEYRVVGGHVDLFVRAVSNSSNGAAVDPRLVYAYDPSEVANLTTVVTALQLQHHVLMHAVSDTNSTTSISPSRVHYDFDYKVPPMALAAAGTNPATGENWQATTSSAYLPYGWTKAVGINFVQAAVTVGIAATHTYHVEFRCRT